MLLVIYIIDVQAFFLAGFPLTESSTIEIIVTGIMAETIARTTYNSCKTVNLFVEEEA